ncbi:hypothetical protein [Acrocarpospora corrugata]|uniref:hypothetical protein n=1 Tax=Acrocarpospora corrugata TaxID=35763 RepID=UPI0012D32179|nr:hypothetical protein [Acrocarpospora corrugata]
MNPDGSVDDLGVDRWSVAGDWPENLDLEGSVEDLDEGPSALGASVVEDGRDLVPEVGLDDGDLKEDPASTVMPDGMRRMTAASGPRVGSGTVIAQAGSEPIT